MEGGKRTGSEIAFKQGGSHKAGPQASADSPTSLNAGLRGTVPKPAAGVRGSGRNGKPGFPSRLPRCAAPAALVPGSAAQSAGVSLQRPGGQGQGLSSRAGCRDAGGGTWGGGVRTQAPEAPAAAAPARRASHAWAPRGRLVPHAPAGGITSQSPAAHPRAALPPPQTLVPRPAPAAAPGTPGAGPRIGAGGDVKRRHGGGPGAGRGGAAADCGDAAARGAAQSVLGAERSGACRCGGRGARRAGRGRELGRAGAESGVGPGQLGPGEEQPWRRGGSGPEPLRAAWAPSSRAGPERGWRRRQLRPRPPPSQAPRPAPGPRRW